MQTRGAFCPLLLFCLWKKKKPNTSSLWSMTCSVNDLSLHLQPVGQQVGLTLSWQPSQVGPETKRGPCVCVTSDPPSPRSQACLRALLERSSLEERDAAGRRVKFGADISRCKGPGAHCMGMKGLGVPGPVCLGHKAVLTLGRAPQVWEMRAFQDISKPSPRARPTSL